MTTDSHPRHRKGVLAWPWLLMTILLMAGMTVVLYHADIDQIERCHAGLQAACDAQRFAPGYSVSVEGGYSTWLRYFVSYTGIGFVPFLAIIAGSIVFVPLSIIKAVTPERPMPSQSTIREAVDDDSPQ